MKRPFMVILEWPSIGTEQNEALRSKTRRDDFGVVKH